MTTQIQHQLHPEKWVDKHADFLYRYAIQRINDREKAKDLVQETFVAGLKSKENFKGKAKERTWLVSILKRKIIDFYRFSNSFKGQAEIKIDYQEPDREGDWLEEKVADQSLANLSDAQLENEELASVLDYCIEGLPTKYKSVFVMKTIHNLEAEEICNDLEISSSNLWVMLHRARTQLRLCLDNKWFNNEV